MTGMGGRGNVEDLETWVRVLYVKSGASGACAWGSG